VVLNTKRPLTTIDTETAEATANAKPKRPRPRLARPHLVETAPAPANATPAPEEAVVPTAQGLWNSKHRPALILGALVILAIIVSNRLLSPHGPGANGAATPTVATVSLVPAGADSTTVTGRVTVAATFTNGDVVAPVKGAQVWVDGEMRATVPVALELPRGPHTIRVNRGGTDSPVKMLLVTGGDQQALNLEFGVGEDPSKLVVLNHSAPAMLDRVATLTAYLDRVSDADLQDMWLSVEENGEWRRIPMTLMPAPGGAVGVAVLPADKLRAPNSLRYYVIATLKSTGEHFYTDIQSSTRK
jgi:hypothetical protein